MGAHPLFHCENTAPGLCCDMSFRGIAIAGGTLFLTMQAVAARQFTVERGNALQSTINQAASGDTIIIGEKTIQAIPSPFDDPLCGNCADPQDEAKASIGYIVKNKSLVIVGMNRTRTRLITGAGYGIYFENSPNSIVRNLTITGGHRDLDGNATDAGIVVRNSRVLIEAVDIIDNTHYYDSTIVGIGGIVGREGADITVRNCTIANNTWDGIALYRGATALITDCVIKKGRGAGIGVTWDATCTAYRNEVTGYWKGIGAFGTSWVVARNNHIHDNLGWGMIATGSSYMDMTNNVVYHNGNCGIAPWSTDSRGRIVNNIIAANGWRDQWVCPCVGVWNYGDWAKWEFAFNIVWKNSAGDYEGIWNQTDLNGNLAVDPLFIDSLGFHLQAESPVNHAGDSTRFNPDGTRSSIGLFGGPQAWPSAGKR